MQRRSSVAAPKIVCVIPSRLKSSRFPSKPLALINNKPMIQWVWEAAVATHLFDDIVIATDSPELAQFVTSFGGKFLMTSPDCLTGTDRLIEIMQKGLMPADIWVNWQGDEPFVNRTIIQNLLQTCSHQDADIWTLKKEITDPREVDELSVGKVVTNRAGYMLYTSRTPIPHYYNQQISKKVYYKHIGLYAFTNTALQTIAQMQPSALELIEVSEQLRWLDHGLTIRVHETKHDVVSIDLPEHIHKAELFLAQREQQTTV